MMTWADGRRYEGNWLEGRCTGHGTTSFKSGSRYVGNYAADKMQGRGSYSFADGRKYEGEYHANQKHGRGVYQWPNGLLYTGTWYRGAPLCGFLLFAGGECAKTTCTSSSSSDTCPDLALLRLQEEAQAWTDARDAKSRLSRASAVGSDIGSDKTSDKRCSQMTDNNVGKSEKETWGGLVGRFGQRRGSHPRPVLQDACDFVLAGHEPAEENRSVDAGRQYGGADGGSGVTDSERQERGNAGRWKFMNVLPIRPRRRQGRARKPRTEAGERVLGKDRLPHARTGSQTDGSAVDLLDTARAHAMLPVDSGGCGGGYSDEELDDLDDDDSDDHDSRQLYGEGDDLLYVQSVEDAAKSHEGSDKHGNSLRVSAHAPLHLEKTVPARRPSGGRRLVEKECRAGRAADVAGTKTNSLQEGDLWFYLIGDTSEGVGQNGGGSAGGGRGGQGSGNGKIVHAVDEFGRSRLVQVCKNSRQSGFASIHTQKFVLCACGCGAFLYRSVFG